MKAFPHTKMERGADGSTWNMAEVRYEGLDLRDYFAAKAMQAFIIKGIVPAEGLTKKQAIVSMAFETADAMMKARND